MYKTAVPAALTQTTSSAVLQLLRQSLDRGRWAAGAPLRQEEIAAEFNVSRVPVREALFQLQAEGLVHAGVVDHEHDRPEFGLDPSDHRLDRGAIRNVSRDRKANSTGRIRFSRGTSDFGIRSRDERDAHSLGSQHQADSPADAAARAGNDGNFAGQVSHALRLRFARAVT